ncbi:MAG: 16S rRNA (guanine(527)-N(7))-methyltransferase RsmG [Fuerstiella sp.]|nr:16S rRNA (guanine(527)-N(7))-methyltransferase RsmG [Fuerstiella sp.]
MSDPDTLKDVLFAHSVVMTDDRQLLLQQYCQSLWSWNSRLNLTRHTNFEAFVTRDLNDSQQLETHLQSGESVLDVGAGGGVPGIVLAILNPGIVVSLCESTQKKANALREIVAQLRLPIDIFAERAEHVLFSHSFDTITARAVAPLQKLIRWFRPHRNRIGRILLVKGPNWAREYDEASQAGLLAADEIQVVAEYTTPGRTGSSVVLEVRIR